MAITTNAVTVTTAWQRQTKSITRWHVNFSSADASGCEQIKATPGAGYELVIERLLVHIGAAITVTIGAGKNGAAVESTVIGPVGGAAGTVDIVRREEPIVLTANKALTIDASGGGVVAGLADGYTRAST